MTVSSEDIFMATLMAYREAANQGDPGLTAVLCVARNNALKHNTSIFAEVTKAFRYSSVNCPLDVTKHSLKELQSIINALSKYPHDTNVVDWNLWKHIGQIVQGVFSETIQDITSGATLYYSTAVMDFPKDWNPAKVVFTCQIGAQKFYKEI